MIRLAALLLVIWAAQAAALAPRPGWAVQPSAKPYAQLLGDLKTAVANAGMVVVTEAGPTDAARARGVTIPGNRVVGVFRNDYAVRVLGLSTAAMIEAPIRFYVTENPDGSATLAWKTPSLVFAPYLAEAPGLDRVAAELDALFETIARDALR